MKKINKKAFAVSRKRMGQMDKDKTERLIRKQFLNEWKGKPVQNLWDNVFPVNSQIMDSILDSSQSDIVETFSEIVKSINKVADQSPEDFNMEVFYRLDGVIRNIIATKMNKSAWSKEVSNVVFIYTNYNFVEKNFKSFITKKEGMACESDKSRWLVDAITHYYSKDIPIDMTIDEHCYWKPHFWTAEQWIELFNAIHSFYFGKFEPYMKFLKDNWIPLLLQPKKVK